MVAVLGLVLTEARDSPRTLVPFALMGLGITAAVLPWAWSTKQRVNQRRALVVGSALFILGVAIFIWPHVFIDRKIVVVQPPTPTPEPIPTAPPVTVTQPDTIGQPIDGCFTFQFEAEPPPGWTFVVANRRNDEALYYFEGEVSVDPANRRWSAHVSLGADGDGMGEVFELHVVMLPEPTAAYLLETHTTGDDTWWASKDLPPEGQPAETIEVRRNDDVELSCAT